MSDARDRLLDAVRSGGTAAVAFSGGVDSAVVLRAAVDVFGDRAVAVTGVGPSLSREERDAARALARSLGVRHVEVDPDELASAGYVANAGDRCLHCKRSLYAAAAPLARALGAPAILNGTNVDDLGDVRPGLVAAEEAGVRSPLVEAGLRKADVRGVAAEWGLPVADKPASPCLASRIAPHVEVTRERLAMVEEAERVVRTLLNVNEFRVRLEAASLARIELPPDRISAAVEYRQRLVRELTALGFRRVSVDLAGFESGNLNAVAGELVSLERPDRQVLPPAGDSAKSR